jgi:hypothetical protein
MTSRLVLATRSVTSTPLFLHNAHSTGFVFITWRAPDITTRLGKQQRSCRFGAIDVRRPLATLQTDSRPRRFAGFPASACDGRAEVNRTAAFRLNKSRLDAEFCGSAGTAVTHGLAQGKQHEGGTPLLDGNNVAHPGCHEADRRPHCRAELRRFRLCCFALGCATFRQDP